MHNIVLYDYTIALSNCMKVLRLKALYGLSIGQVLPVNYSSYALMLSLLLRSYSIDI
jgi:hypothetical protein